MKPVRTQVIANPESNRGRTRRRWKDIREVIRSFIPSHLLIKGYV